MHHRLIALTALIAFAAATQLASGCRDDDSLTQPTAERTTSTPSTRPTPTPTAAPTRTPTTGAPAPITYVSGGNRITRTCEPSGVRTRRADGSVDSNPVGIFASLFGRSQLDVGGGLTLGQWAKSCERWAAANPAPSRTTSPTRTRTPSTLPDSLLDGAGNAIFVCVDRGYVRWGGGDLPVQVWSTDRMLAEIDTNADLRRHESYDRIRDWTLQCAGR